MHNHDARHLTGNELASARHALAAGLALSRPGSPIHAPIQAQLSAIDTETARRRTTATAIGRCSCGFATSDYEWLAGHISENPGHDLADSYGNWELGRHDDGNDSRFETGRIPVTG